MTLKPGILIKEKYGMGACFGLILSIQKTEKFHIHVITTLWLWDGKITSNSIAFIENHYETFIDK